MSLVNIIVTILKFFPVQECIQYKQFIRKIIIYSVSFVFLIGSFITGYIALYYYLVPHWGEALAALSLCLLSLIVSMTLILTAKLLKPKKKQASSQVFPFFEKSLDQVLNTQDLTNTLKKASPKVLVAVMGAAAMASYIVFIKKNYGHTKRNR